MAAKILVCVFVIVQCIQRINSQATYTAAVAEYTPIRDISVSDETNLLANVRQYVELIWHARNRTADIVVFPEYGLTSLNLPDNLDNVSVLLPHPAQRFVPCDSPSNTSKILVDLSCAARSHRIYTVVNLLERETDVSNNTIYFNTNIVFDRNGTIISRYRKINLYNEPRLTPGDEVVTFDTDFGVKFGMFICWDIMFRRPALEILEAGNITDVIYPVAWHSETPFLQALSIQDGYARVNGINFLVAGYSNATGSNGGAGLFFANTTRSDLSIATADGRNLIVQSVPRISARTPDFVCQDSNIVDLRLGGNVPAVSTFFTYSEDLSNYTFQSLQLESSTVNGEVCSEDTDFCCTYELELAQPLTENSTVYRFVAFYGSRNVGLSTTIGVRACALVACLSEDETTCGQRSGNATTNVIFNFVHITARVGGEREEAYYQPSTLTYELQPVVNYTFCNTRNDDNNDVAHVRIGQTQASLFSFGILGRVFSLDGQPPGRSSAYSAQANVAVLVLLLTYVHLR